MPNEFTPIVAIYGLIDPRTGCIRYVGKTKTTLEKRYANHISSKGRSRKYAWVKRLRSLGLMPEMIPLQFVPADSWETAEQWWIAHFREHGAGLLNDTAGGDGCVDPSPEARAKMSASQKRRVFPSPSPETRAKISAANRGRPKMYTDDGLARLKAAARQQWRDPLFRKMRDGIVYSDETRARWKAAAVRRAEDGFRGENTPCSKMTEAGVVELRNAYAAGGATISELASRYDISGAAASAIIRRDVWRHVGGAEPPSWVAEQNRVPSAETKSSMSHAAKLRVERGFRGEGCPTSKLTEANVTEMRRDYATGNVSQRALAKRYGVSKPVITNALRGDTWAHVPAEIDRAAVCRRASENQAAVTKLTDTDVVAIRESFTAGDSIVDLACRYNVTSPLIGSILRGKARKTAGGPVFSQEEMTARAKESRKTQRRCRGESHASAKLTADIVLDMRSMRADGATFQAIADKYGVTKQSTIAVVKRKTWRHVDDQSIGQNSGKMLSSSEKLGIGRSMLSDGNGIGGNGSEGKLQSDAMVPHGEMNTEVDATPAEPLELGTPTTAAVAAVAAAPMSVAPNTNMP